jgi:hypothetical protein
MQFLNYAANTRADLRWKRHGPHLRIGRIGAGAELVPAGEVIALWLDVAARIVATIHAELLGAPVRSASWSALALALASACAC